MRMLCFFCLALRMLALGAAVALSGKPVINPGAARYTKLSNPHVPGGTLNQKVDLLSSQQYDQRDNSSDSAQEPGAEKQDHESQANSVAFVLVTFAILIPIVSYMAMQEGEVSLLTLKALDYFVTLFIALLYFQVLTNILELPVWQNVFPGPHTEEIVLTLQSCVLYLLGLLLLYKYRDDDRYLMILAGLTAHYVAFGAIAASQEYQHNSGALVSRELGWTMSFAFVVATFVVLLLCGTVTHWCVSNKAGNDELMHALSHMELDIIGLVISFLTMQAVRHALTGRYPPQAHMLIQLSGVGLKHSATQRMLMLLFAVTLTILATIFLLWLERCKDLLEDGTFAGRWKLKFIHIFRIILIMCSAWGYLLWGQWQFNESMYSDCVMFGQVLFASIITVFSLVSIWGLSYINKKFSSLGPAVRFIVMGVSLMMAWSWEHCFGFALDVLGDSYQVGYHGLVPKTIIAVVLPLAILPVHLKYLHRRVEDLKEELEEEHGLETPLRTPTRTATTWPIRGKVPHKTAPASLKVPHKAALAAGAAGAGAGADGQGVGTLHRTSLP